MKTSRKALTLKIFGLRVLTILWWEIVPEGGYFCPRTNSHACPAESAETSSRNRKLSK